MAHGDCGAGGGDFAHALRTAVAARGITLRDLRAELAAHRLDVSVSTLSMWQSGKRHPSEGRSREILDGLESVLDLSPGTLSRPAERAPLPGRPPASRPLPEQMPQREVTDLALAELGFVTEDCVPHELVVTERVRLLRAAGSATSDITVLARQLHEGPLRLPSLHILGEDEPNVPPEILPADGCRIGRSLAWPEVRAYGAELILDRDLAPGEAAACNYQVRFPLAPDRLHEVSYSVSRRAHDIFLQVEFDEDLEPDDCEAFLRPLSGGPEAEEVRPVRRNAEHRIQTLASNFGPGLVGLRWRWEDAV